MSIGPKGEEPLPEQSPALTSSPRDERISTISKEILDTFKPLNVQTPLHFSAQPLTGVNYFLAFVRDIMARVFGPSDKIAETTALLDKSTWSEKDFNKASKLHEYFPETRRAEAFAKADAFVRKESQAKEFKAFIEPYLDNPKALREALNKSEVETWAASNPLIKNVRADLLKIFAQEDRAEAIREAVGELKRVDTPETRINVGYHFLHQGNLVEAAKYLGEDFADLKDSALILETVPHLIKAGKERIAVRLLKTIANMPAAKLQLFSCLVPTNYASFFAVEKEGAYEGSLAEALLYRDLSEEEKLDLARLALDQGDFTVAEQLLRQNFYDFSVADGKVKTSDAEAVLVLAEVYKAKGHRQGVLDLVKLMETKGFGTHVLREQARRLEAYAYIEGDTSLPRDITKGINLLKLRNISLEVREALRLAALAEDVSQGAYLVEMFVPPISIPAELAHTFAWRFLEKGELDKAFVWFKRSGDEVTAQDYKTLGAAFKSKGFEAKAAAAFMHALEKEKSKDVTDLLNESLKTSLSLPELRALSVNDLLKLQKAYIALTNKTEGLAAQIAAIIQHKNEGTGGDFSGYVEIGRHLLAIGDKKGLELLEDLILRNDASSRSKYDAALILIPAYLNGITAPESLADAMRVAQIAYYGTPSQLIKSYVEKMGIAIPDELREAYNRILLKTEYPTNPPEFFRTL